MVLMARVNFLHRKFLPINIPSMLQGGKKNPPLKVVFCVVMPEEKSVHTKKTSRIEP